MDTRDGQHAVVHVGREGDAAGQRHITLQVRCKGAEIGVRRGLVDLTQAHGRVFFALGQLVETGQAGAGDHGAGAVGQHIQAFGLGVFAQQFQQAGKLGFGAARVGHVGGVTHEVLCRWPGKKQHHRVAAGEVPVLGGLPGGALHAGIGTVDIDGQVFVHALFEGVVDLFEKCITLGAV